MKPAVTDPQNLRLRIWGPKLNRTLNSWLMKRFHIISIVLGAALLMFLTWQIGFLKLWKELVLLGWGLAPLIFIGGVAHIFHAFGWRRCLVGEARSLPLFQVFRILMAGYSINYLTPTATLGGEVTKGTLLSVNHNGTEAVAGVIVGKLAYSLAQLLFVSLGSIFTLWGADLPAGVWLALLLSSALLASGMIGFLLVQKYGKLGVIVRWLAARKACGKMLQKAAHHITAVDEELRKFYKSHPYDLPSAILWHIAGMACGIIQAWYFLFRLTDHASLETATEVYFLGSWFDLLAFAIPLNIGVQEGTRIVAFKVVGLGSVMGLAYGLTLRFEQIFWTGIGLLGYANLLSEQRKSTQISLPYGNQKTPGVSGNVPHGAP